MTLPLTDTTVRTTCPYCGVGCGVLATPQSDGSVAVAGDPDHPANYGRLCSKGSALGETLSLDGRLLHPEMNGERVDWDTALTTIAQKFMDIVMNFGPDAVAFYGSGQLLTEDYYLANKLMKGFIGSGNIDTNSRLCMASSVAGHKRAFGSDTVPGNYEDLELADLVVLVGSNLGWCHPVLYQRIVAAREKRPHMRVVVIDPRKTASVDLADLHLAIASDGDTALFVGLLQDLDERRAIDTGFVGNYTEGFRLTLAAARDWTVARVAQATGLSHRDIALFYDWFAATEKVVTIYSQGVNQSATGTDKVNAIINCHLATGRIGLSGMGPFSITGQPNAMGGREVGGLANMLAAHMDFDEASRDRVSRFWGTDRVASKPGLKAVDLFEAVAAGKIKALWIMATNPVDSMPEANKVRAAIRACPFVIVSDISTATDTGIEAHIRLPAAGWGEKDGTVTNSERRISRQRPFLPLPGEARPDWWIVSQVARRMGFSEAFPYRNAGEIFAEHVALSAFENGGTRDFDLTPFAGLDYDRMTPRQWGRPRMFADGKFFTPSTRARFVEVTPPPPLVAAPGMLLLNTGRVRDHWHTMTRTGKAARLSAHMAEPFVEVHPDDAATYSIKRATLVRLENQHGSAVVRALITERQRKGSVFVPMHWTGQFSSAGRIDALVRGQVDPTSGQPALKMAQVSVGPAGMRWYGFAVAAKTPALDGTGYWALAQAEGGVRIELGWETAPDDWEGWVRTAFRLAEDVTILAFSDSHSGRRSFALFHGDQLAFALYLSPEPVLVSRQWAVSLLTDPPKRRADVLAGRPGLDRPDGGAIVCACFQVGINSIAEAIAQGCHTVEAVGNTLRAGTNCGSCRSEIRSIIAARLQETVK